MPRGDGGNYRVIDDPTAADKITWGPQGTIYANIDINSLSPDQRAEFDKAYGGGNESYYGNQYWEPPQGEVDENGQGRGIRYEYANKPVYQWQMPQNTAAPPPVQTPAPSGGGGGASYSGTPAQPAAAKPTAAPAAAVEAPTGGGGGGGAAEEIDVPKAPSLGGLQAAANSGGDESKELTPPSIRDGIGVRTLPQESMALAGLRKAY